MVSASDSLRLKGEVFVLGLRPDVRTYDEYLALGFARKKLTRDLVAELCADGVVDSHWHGPNLIVNAGLLQVVNLVTGNISSYVQSPPTGWFGYAGVGSGTTTPAATDTDLTGPYIGSRLQCSATYAIGSAEAKFDTYVPPATWQGTWYEAGNFTSITTGAGTMGSHLLINPTSGYVKGNFSVILDFQWNLTG